jgi:Protein of unknown function (DUF998)
MPGGASWMIPAAARSEAAAGIMGPAVFTAAWIASSLRQGQYPAAEIQISGLAAPGARDPGIMVAGFVVLGGCTVAFGAALHDALCGCGQAGPAPRLIQAAGLLTVAAGLLRRDRMLLAPGSVSWHNHAHDVISLLIYVDLVVAQMLLAARFGRDPRGPDPGWRSWRPWLLASSVATGAVLAAFAADTSAAAAGVLQRVGVSIPLAAVAAIAVRLLGSPARGGPPARNGPKARGGRP